MRWLNYRSSHKELQAKKGTLSDCMPGRKLAAGDINGQSCRSGRAGGLGGER
jgi:hypothetical protein